MPRHNPWPGDEEVERKADRQIARGCLPLTLVGFVIFMGLALIGAALERAWPWLGRPIVG